MRYMIVAYDRNRVIGANNTIPWLGVLPADLQHFKKITLGKTVLMGRKTYESIGHALPYRQNIVLTRQDLEYDDAKVVHSLAHAYAEAENEIVIIGGAEIYAQSLDDTDVIYATEIDTNSGGDTYFPQLTPDWTETSREDHLADKNNKYNYSFVTYTKQK